MLNNEEFNLLKFRDEYIKLLQKYDIELEANELGQIQLYTNTGKSYLLNGFNGIYNNDKNLMNEFILSSFNGHANNIVSRNIIGIISNDKEKVEDLFLDIKDKNKDIINQYYISNDNGGIKFNNGIEFIWSKYSGNVRGACFKKAIIDCNLYELDNFINYVAYGCCRYNSILRRDE